MRPVNHRIPHDDRTYRNIVHISHGDLFRAIDIETGETLWSAELPAGGQANPITYEVDGQQYVMVTAMGHHFMESGVGDEVMAWALPAD